MAVLLGAVNVITAKSKRNQAILNKAIYWDAKYDKLSTERDMAYDSGNEKLGRSLDRQCENAFDKYLEYLRALPKTEQKRVENYSNKKY